MEQYRMTQTTEISGVAHPASSITFSRDEMLDWFFLNSEGLCPEENNEPGNPGDRERIWEDIQMSGHHIEIVPLGMGDSVAITYARL